MKVFSSYLVIKTYSLKSNLCPRMVRGFEIYFCRTSWSTFFKPSWLGISKMLSMRWIPRPPDFIQGFTIQRFLLFLPGTSLKSISFWGDVWAILLMAMSRSLGRLNVSGTNSSFSLNCSMNFACNFANSFFLHNFMTPGIRFTFAWQKQHQYIKHDQWENRSRLWTSECVTSPLGSYWANLYIGHCRTIAWLPGRGF